MIGDIVIKLKSVDSTNSYARELLQSTKVNDGTAIVAEEQFAGRGQHANVWETQSGKNLTLSVVLYPKFLQIVNQFLLSQFVALAVRNTVENLLKSVNCNEKVWVKWSNDIFVKNRKIGGILIENSLRGNLIDNTIVGIGLNVNQIEFVSDLTQKASSLLKITDFQFDLGEVSKILFSYLQKYYDWLQNNPNTIKQEYLEYLLGYKKINLFSDYHSQFSGKIVGIDEIGRLKIEKESGKIMKYEIKEVEFVNLYENASIFS